jgi:SagB-type dehydrogenase family enzyme
MDRKGWKAIIVVIVILAVTGVAFYVYYFSTPTTSGSNPRVVQSVVNLPTPITSGQMSVETALQERRSVRTYSNQSLTLTDISQLLWAAQGITDSQNNFRTAPSGGHSYPLEVYLVAGSGGVNGLETGLYHYNPQKHQLEKLSGSDLRSNLSEIADGQPWVKNAPVDIVITGVYQTMFNKYGNNNVSVRFVQEEAGHVGQNIYLEATARGLATVALGSYDDAKVKVLLNLPTNESTMYIFPVGVPV